MVQDGYSSLDTSAITGESIPVEVGAGDEVRCRIGERLGHARIRATAAGTDNSLTQIVRLVEQAPCPQGRESQARRPDRAPAGARVLLLSATVALLGLLTDDPGLWLERALVVLVAASPCAMAIAVPVTVISAIGSASKLGVVIKSGAGFRAARHRPYGRARQDRNADSQPARGRRGRNDQWVRRGHRARPRRRTGSHEHPTRSPTRSARPPAWH
ncbi:P-type ATPase [Nocardioides palaemonis]|uniref:P-type ATPase n=1 Tax=Nocardioides palaemonis TaxID=2829810 RepID=UPI0035585BEC